MKKNEKYLVIAGLMAAFMLIPKLSRAAYYTITDWLIPNFEGFRATPYWDVSRWSWGYGTQAPGSTGTISREQALTDMRTVVDSDYRYLSPMVTRSLNANQWAALLSFSYNLGRGNADNLINNINTGNDAALQVQWKQYINAAGVPNDTLISRRNTEWQVWSGNLS